MNKTLNNLISDCNAGIPFIERFLEGYSYELNDLLIPIITNLNHQISNQFLKSIERVNITSELHLLNNFLNLLGSNQIQHHLDIIQNDLKQIDRIFTQIVQHNSQLSMKVFKNLLNEVRSVCFNLDLQMIFFFSLKYF